MPGGGDPATETASPAELVDLVLGLPHAGQAQLAGTAFLSSSGCRVSDSDSDSSNDAGDAESRLGQDSAEEEDGAQGQPALLLFLLQPALPAPVKPPVEWTVNGEPETAASEEKTDGAASLIDGRQAVLISQQSPLTLAVSEPGFGDNKPPEPGLPMPAASDGEAISCSTIGSTETASEEAVSALDNSPHDKVQPANDQTRTRELELSVEGRLEARRIPSERSLDQRPALTGAADSNSTAQTTVSRRAFAVETVPSDTAIAPASDSSRNQAEAKRPRNEIAGAGSDSSNRGAAAQAGASSQQLQESAQPEGRRQQGEGSPSGSSSGEGSSSSTATPKAATASPHAARSPRTLEPEQLDHLQASPLAQAHGGDTAGTPASGRARENGPAGPAQLLRESALDAPSQTSAQPLKQLAVQVEASDGRRIQLQLSDLGGQVGLRMRTSDPQLSGRLQENLQPWTQDLHSKGWTAELRPVEVSANTLGGQERAGSSLAADHASAARKDSDEPGVKFVANASFGTQSHSEKGAGGDRGGSAAAAWTEDGNELDEMTALRRLAALGGRR